MNLDIQWMQNHIGTLVTEIAAMRGEISNLRNELQNKELVIADLKDQVERLSPVGDEGPR